MKDYPARLTLPVFVTEEVRLDADFAAARAGLAGLTREGGLVTASHEAWRLEGVMPARAVSQARGARVSRLAGVQAGELMTRGPTAMVALRWQAAGYGGELFPVLDADIKLSPAGEHVTLLTVWGVCRLPFGANVGDPDSVLRRAAGAAMQGFTARLAAVIIRGAAARAAG